mmetsp:Transcript_1868/g.2056  ORF Transcript_1868/g.2056 Transcript_1868/m.2056 type:complete len:117 (-) Transcript_1868:150-500(-)
MCILMKRAKRPAKSGTCICELLRQSVSQRIPLLRECVFRLVSIMVQQQGESIYCSTWASSARARQPHPGGERCERIELLHGEMKTLKRGTVLGERGSARCEIDLFEEFMSCIPIER